LQQYSDEPRTRLKRKTSGWRHAGCSEEWQGGSLNCCAETRWSWFSSLHEHWMTPEYCTQSEQIKCLELKNRNVIINSGPCLRSDRLCSVLWQELRSTMRSDVVVVVMVCWGGVKLLHKRVLLKLHCCVESCVLHARIRYL
jgi:hypothetical protein